MSQSENSVFVNALKRVLRKHGYRYIDHIEFNGAEYVLVSSPDEGGAFEYATVFEVDTDTDELDAYSFSIVEDATIIEVLRAYGSKRNSEGT